MRDVVIVGAGPVGLFLACELGLAGCSVLVLEREPEPGSPWRADPLGMRGLSAASAGAFHRRGMLRPLLATSGLPDRSDRPGDGTDEAAPPRSAGHFAGMVLDPARVDLDALPYRVPGPAAEGVMTNLAAIEAVLHERATALGVEVRRGVTVAGIARDEEGVTVRAEADGPGRERTYAARWLVGCDGGRSAVRRAAGFEFTGTEPQFTGYVVLADVADPEKLRPGFTLTPAGMYVRMPAKGHLGVLEGDGGAFDRSRPLTREHLQAVLRRVSGTDVTLNDVRHASSFTDRAMQATTYRRGHVLLAGDAAHIHSPLGAQGLNLGIGDAMNLGWKLAATVRGHAPDGLLDTYARERHPVGARVLDWTRAQSAVMRPGPYAQALQGVLRDLLGTRDGTTYTYGTVSGASLRHDLGDDLGDAHPLVGREAPDLRLADGTRLGELARDGRGLALDLTPDRSLRGAARRWERRIRYVAGPATDTLGADAVLVRPDGVVAWAGGRAPDGEAFARAATRWFGLRPGTTR
ncbi:FAD-dependent oxidoreductase [Streptomyces sp. NPDC048172]|uniref:FAD-dependent oxidoreductase n=1 Tax=Streptomyces sp. NPDC048172 TaxID=3365505 RepID=UPI0037192AC2